MDPKNLTRRVIEIVEVAYGQKFENEKLKEEIENLLVSYLVYAVKLGVEEGEAIMRGIKP